MKSKFTWIFTLFMAFFIQLAFAQEKTVSGTVTGSDGMPLPGVVVQVEGTSVPVVITDVDGKFTITASVGQKLSFTYVSTQPVVVVVDSKNEYSVTMQDEVLEEVVVQQGYKTMAKATTTVAQSTVTAKTIENRPNANFMQTLQGQVPGLNISTGSGQPGANSTVILRGYGSINGNVEPLYVIDGVPLNADNFKSINPNDIETVTVLKDAGATSIYGNRGANGVIVVKTKRGGYNKALAIKYSSNAGFSKMQGEDYNIMNSQQLLGLQKVYGQGFGSTLTDEQIAAYPISTNWKNQFFQTGSYQNHTLNLSSGGENLSSFTSINYFDQEGIVKGTSLQRFSFRNNLAGKSANDKFNYTTSLTINYSTTNQLSAAAEGTAFVNTNPVLGALQGAPYLSPSWYQNGLQLFNAYNADGPVSFGDGLYTYTPGTMVITPLMLLDRINGNNYVNRTNEIKSIANMQGNYKITDDLSIGGTFGMDYTDQKGLVYNSPDAFNAYVWWPEDSGYEYRGSQSESYLRQVLFNVNTNLNYSKTFGDHSIDASVFTEYFKGHYKTFSYTQEGLDPKVSGPDNGNGYIPQDPTGDFPAYYVPTVGSAKITAGLFSYFGSVDYGYKDRYGISGTVRRDASYRFAETNRWGTFWSVSGRWNIDREDFMAGSVFDQLKLRASIGTAGNQNISGQSLFSNPTASRTIYATGTGYSNQNAYVIGSLGNNDLKWETIGQTDIGVDFGLFKNRLRGVVDVYSKTTKDLYLETPLSAVTGFQTLDANNGELSNKGVELQVSYDVFPANSDFKLTLNANGSFNKSKIVDVPNEGGIIDYNQQVIQEGRGYLEYYLVKYAGVNPANGNLLYYNKEGEITENPDPLEDRVLTGKSPIPKYQGSFGFDADYKGFFLTTQFNFVADIYRFDYDLSTLQDPTSIVNFNGSTDLLDSWTPDNRNASLPSLTASNLNAYDGTSDRYLIDSSYLRLRYITLGYNIPQSFLNKTFLTSVRIYGQAENILTWSKWRGWDAESNRSSDQNNYPTPKTYSVGVEIQF
jgi:TonB-dependent starch-binding outer membrane protein SusC